MKHTTILHNTTYGRNLYTGEPSAALPAEAERLRWNRAVIAEDLRRDPRSWASGRNNVDVLDVLFADAVAAMLTQPAMMTGVAS
jgi:hypothetical protein